MDSSTVPTGATMTRTTRLPVTGMSCDSCATTIERELTAVPGVASTRVDFVVFGYSRGTLLRVPERVGGGLELRGRVLPPSMPPRSHRTLRGDAFGIKRWRRRLLAQAEAATGVELRRHGLTSILGAASNDATALLETIAA